MNDTQLIQSNENIQIEYVIPKDDIKLIQKNKDYVFWILIFVIILGFTLGFLGIVVEYTKLGSYQLSHEETNFANIDIPMIYHGSTREQLSQIMMIKDELLRNSKRLWASIVLCYSYTRNLRLLF